MPSRKTKLIARNKKLRATGRKKSGEPNFAKLAKRFCGMMEGPRDLSTRGSMR